MSLSVHLASRIEVFPAAGTGTTGSGASPRPSTIYFYIGLDFSSDAASSEDEGSYSEARGGKSGAALTVVDDGSESASPRRSLLVRGAHPQHGGFELAASVAAPTATRDSGGGAAASSEGDRGLTVAFVGKGGAAIADVKQEVERLHEAHRRATRRAKTKEGSETGPFVLPNKADAGSNVVLVQVSEIKTHYDIVVVDRQFVWEFLTSFLHDPEIHNLLALL